MDPRGCDQVPGPRPAPHRPKPGRRRRPAGRRRRPGAALGVRASHLPGSTRAGRSPARATRRAWLAHALGTDPEQLDAALAGRADAAQDTRTQTGLRTDQAAAAQSVLTDGTRVSVINAPAGSGKTRVLTDTGHAWTAAGLGPVVGITAAQSARNTLAAGVPVSYNAAQFLGHLPGRRGARGPVETGRAPPAGGR